MSSSINTNIASFFAQANIASASNAASSSVSRLSSGNRIVQASDDVAALAIGASLQSQVSALKTAQTNASQGTSLLQVADGALAQIQSILQQQQSLALQAKSGSLTDTNRGFLNQQFQALSSEINILANSTTFNGVNLIDGSISGGTNINTNITDGSTSGPISAKIGTIGTVVSGNTFTLKVAGQATQTFTFGTASGDVGIGATAADSAANLASAINNSGLSQLANVRVEASGADIYAYYTGSATSLSNIPTITSGTNSSTTVTNTGAASFANGSTLGTITGVIHDGDTFTIGSHTLTFKDTVTDATSQVAIGASTTSTALANLVTFLNAKAGTSGYSDIDNIAFSSDYSSSTGTGHLYGVYSGNGTHPTLSTSFVNNTATNFGGGTSQHVGDGTTILTLDSNSITRGASTLSIGGATITFASSSSGTSTLTATLDASGTLANTLTNIVNYLNGTTVNGLLNAGYTGAKYSTDGTHLYLNNVTNDTTQTVSTTLLNGANTITTMSTTSVTPLNNGKTAAFGGLTGTFAAGDTFTIGGVSFTVSNSGTTGTSTTLDVGTGNADVLGYAVTYLNSATGQTALGSNGGLTFSYSGGSIYVTNPRASTINPAAFTTTIGGGNTGATAASTTLTNATISANNDIVLSGGSGAGGLTIANGSVFNLGAAAITFVPNGTTPGTGQVARGATDSATLAALATYLNSTAGQSYISSTAYAGLVFTSDTTHLYVSNSTGSAITPSNTIGTGTTPTGTTVVSSATVTPSYTIGSFSGTGVIGTGDVLTFGTATNQASGTITSGTTMSIGGAAITFGNQAAVTAGTAKVLLGSDNFETLYNLAAYLNDSTVNASLSSGTAGLTFSTDGTHLIATNSTGGSKTPATTSLGGTGATGAVGLASAALANGSSANLITMGIDTIKVGTAAQVTAGTATVAQGASLTATLANVVTFLNSNAPTGSYAVFSKSGSQLFAQNDQSTAAGGAGSTSTLTSTYTSATSPTFTGVTNLNISADSISGLGAGRTSAVGTPTGSLFVSNTGTSATNFGTAVDLSDVANNAAFVGAFNNIKANYVSTGTTSTSGVQFSLVVGDDTYTTNTITNATLNGTAPVALTFTGSNTITSAAEGGSFTLTLQPQANVTSQNDATQLAQGINAALASVSAYQNRNVLSFNNNYSASVNGVQIATLAGASVSLNSNNFTNPTISSISVSAPSNGSTDAKISAVVNGSTYSTVSGIGNTFSANNEIVLVNANNPNETLTLTLGAAGSADLSNDSNAAAFQTTLSNAFGLDSSAGGLSFQLGSTSGSSVSVTIASAKTDSLYSGSTLDISTQNGADAAATAISTALDSVTAIRARVGALESQFGFAAAALQSSVQNQTAAVSQFLDTDISTESTSYATSQVKLQAGISVLAQANQQLQALLKLIG